MILYGLQAGHDRRDELAEQRHGAGGNPCFLGGLPGGLAPACGGCGQDRRNEFAAIKVRANSKAS
jgi:hypothetical protein